MILVLVPSLYESFVRSFFFFSMYFLIFLFFLLFFLNAFIYLYIYIYIHGNLCDTFMYIANLHGYAALWKLSDQLMPNYVNQIKNCVTIYFRIFVYLFFTLFFTFAP